MTIPAEPTQAPVNPPFDDRAASEIASVTERLVALEAQVDALLAENSDLRARIAHRETLRDEMIAPLFAALASLDEKTRPGFRAASALGRPSPTPRA